MLIPLGYQFEADTLKYVYEKQDAAAPLVNIDDVVAAFGRGVNHPPLNTSRENFTVFFC